jgi:hypothetical protein
MLFLDGVYIEPAHGNKVRFRRVKAPNTDELIRLTHTIAHRVGRYLERQGLLERDTGNIYLTPEAMDTSDEDPSNQLLGSSITYRIAVGPQQGHKVFTLQTLPDCQSDNSFSNSVGRLSMTRNGRVRYELKTPWRNGTTHVIFEPLDFISRLVSLVPKPRVNLTRFHGVFAPNSKCRALVTPAKRGKGKKARASDEAQYQTSAEKRASMTWAKRLKRVFNIDIETCSECGGDVRIIASIRPQGCGR